MARSVRKTLGKSNDSGGRAGDPRRSRTIRFSDSEWNLIQRAAARHGIPVAELVRSGAVAAAQAVALDTEKAGRDDEIAGLGSFLSRIAPASPEPAIVSGDHRTESVETLRALTARRRHCRRRSRTRGACRSTGRAGSA